MQESIRKAVSYLLIIVVLLFTVIGLLGVWEIIDITEIIPKIIGSLLILFASSAVILFIFSVFLKERSDD